MGQDKVPEELLEEAYTFLDKHFIMLDIDK